MTPTSSLQLIIDRRAQQLERIKTSISLKTYDMLHKKLARERDAVMHANDRATQATERRERAQILPKTLFTQRSLPRKPIRID